MSEQLTSERRQEIDRLISAWISEEDIPGASLVLVDGDEMIYAEGFGARDLRHNEPATPDTLYGFASISKSVTGLAILQLVEEGSLTVDDSVSDHVDYFADVAGEPVTIRDLLTHTSGMPSTGTGLITQFQRLEPAGPLGDWDDHRRWVSEAANLRVTDEDRFFYYNMGYGVLSQVVEAVDGRRFADYVTEEIFAPLGMERSTYDREDFEADDDAMTPYRPVDDDLERTEFPFDESFHGSGGMLSSVQELSRYLRAMASDGSFDDARVCSPESLADLQAPHVDRMERIDGTPNRYGYGWMREPFLDDELVGHSGSILVSTAYLGFLDDRKLGVVLACNGSPDRHPRQIGPGVLAIAKGEEPTEVPQLALRKKLEAVTGRYEGFREGMIAEVERDGGGLRVRMESPYGNREFTAQPNSLDPDDTVFSVTTDGAARVPLEFDLDADPADMYFRRYRLQRS